MKFVTENARQLVLANRPKILPMLIAGFGVIELGIGLNSLLKGGDLGLVPFFGAIGSFAIAGFLASLRSEFRFEVDSRAVYWRRRFLFSVDSGQFPLDDISSVSVQTQKDSDGESRRVVIHTANSVVPLKPYFSGVESHQETADRISTWLRAAGVRLQS